MCAYVVYAITATRRAIFLRCRRRSDVIRRRARPRWTRSAVPLQLVNNYAIVCGHATRYAAYGIRIGGTRAVCPQLVLLRAVRARLARYRRFWIFSPDDGATEEGGGVVNSGFGTSHFGPSGRKNKNKARLNMSFPYTRTVYAGACFYSVLKIVVAFEYTSCNVHRTCFIWIVVVFQLCLEEIFHVWTVSSDESWSRHSRTT